MIRLHLLGDGPPNPADLAEALRAIASDIDLGGWSGETVVDAWVGRTDIDLGEPIVTSDDAETRYVSWSVTWD